MLKSKKSLLFILPLGLIVVLLIYAFAMDAGGSTVSKSIAAANANKQGAAVQFPAVGSSVPDFTAVSNTGKEIKLSELKGKVVVLNVWASSCPPCRAEMPDFQSFYEKHKDEQDFVLIMLNATQGRETAEKADQYIKGEGFTFPYYYSDAEAKTLTTLMTFSYPTTYVINAEGQVSAVFLGTTTEQKVEQALQAARKA